MGITNTSSSRVQLAKGVNAIRDPATFTAVLGGEGLQPGEVRGAVVVPGRYAPARGIHHDLTAIGLDDLRELADAAATPRQLWEAIKAREVAAALPVRMYEQALDAWQFVFDAVDTAAIPAWLRAGARFTRPQR